MNPSSNPKAYLVGGGIASLSAAVYLIRDAGMKGSDITIFDESERMGGSLDAMDLSSSEGYSMRGIRMFEEKAYDCLFDLMSSIPSLAHPGQTLREEFLDFVRVNKSYSKARLLKHGQAIDGRPLQLSLRDRFAMLRLLVTRESSIEDRDIQSFFSPSFLSSNFWYEFCTVFAFEPWHSLIEFRRYFLRFIQSFPTIDTLESIESSPYNQYESLVLPVMGWLRNQGVSFVPKTRIVDIGFSEEGEKRTATLIRLERDGTAGDIALAPEDLLFVTLGSLVANSSTGSMREAPTIDPERRDASWALWERIALGRPEFGVPAVFDSQVDKSIWSSFTVTFRDPLFFELIDRFIHRDVTAYGGVNMIDSNWLMSIVLSYKPYFINQPEGVNLCWGYGLYSDKEGNFVKKRMVDCTGEEILTELVYQLGFGEHLERILATSVCIPCTMPYVTSLFLPRKGTDRPAVVPKGATNFAFLGQYVEIPDEVVFTVEHSVRSAQTAVYALRSVNKRVSPIYKGAHHPGVLLRALKTLLR